jgi:hypothetical protein
VSKPPVFKPTIPPLVILMANCGLMIAGTRAPEWLLGALLGAALLWLTIAALSVRGNIVKRWPQTREWFPFLDPSGGIAAETELRSSYIAHKHVRISDLAVNNKVVERTFEDCHIYGPAVLVLSGVGVVVDCAIEGPADTALLYPADSQKRVLGPIEIVNTSFKRCQFHGVGFTGPRPLLDKLAAGSLGSAPSSKQAD